MNPTNRRTLKPKGPKGMAPKYPLHTMQVGEIIVIRTEMKHENFQPYVRHRALILNRRFTTLRLSDGVYEVRRIDGLPDEDQLAKARTRSAQLRKERVRGEK